MTNVAQDKKPAKPTKVLIEIQRMRVNEGDDVTFMALLGMDAHGRWAKAVFNGFRAKKLHGEITRILAGRPIDGARVTIEVEGVWKTEDKPRTRGGQVVLNGAGKPVYERYIDVNGNAAVLTGPVLELFRVQKEAKRRSAEIDKLIGAGDKDAALKIALDFIATISQRPREVVPANAEFQAAVAAAQVAPESIRPQETDADVLGSSKARAIPGTQDTAPEVKAVADQVELARKQEEAAKPVAPPKAEEAVSPRPVEPVGGDPEAEAAARYEAMGRAPPLEEPAAAPEVVSAPVEEDIPPPPTERPVPMAAEPVAPAETASVPSVPEEDIPPPPAERPVPMPREEGPESEGAAPAVAEDAREPVQQESVKEEAAQAPPPRPRSPFMGFGRR